MTAEDLGWRIDDEPDTDDCDLGQHNWGDPWECELCGDSRCIVYCRDCGTTDRACDD